MSDTFLSPAWPARIEITSSIDASLSLGDNKQPLIAGWGHLPNALGVEDRHVQWTLFQALESPETKPIITSISGGPGATAYITSFRGASLFTLDAEANLVVSKNPWTAFANILVIEHPVGVGFSWADEGVEGVRGLPGSSAEAGQDVDALLQGLFRALPEYKNCLLSHNSISYGGTLGTNIAHQVHAGNEYKEYSRKLAGKAEEKVGRIPVRFDSLTFGNPWLDMMTHTRWWHQTKCIDNKVFDAATCASHIKSLPGALDALQYAYEARTVEARQAANTACEEFDNSEITGEASLCDPADVRRPSVADHLKRDPLFQPLIKFMNSQTMRDALGIPMESKWELDGGEINEKLGDNGDHICETYKLLGPIVDSGTRLLVYNGLCDTLCGWRGIQAWMKLLQSKYQDAFRNADKVNVPGIGWSHSSTLGENGELLYALIGIDEAEHDAFASQPVIITELVKNFVQGQAWSADSRQ